MKGCARYIYPLIPLATADAFRTLELHVQGREMEHIVEMDALYGTHFPSLANVSKLGFTLIYPFEGRAPMNALLMNMPRLEEIHCRQRLPLAHRTTGIAAALLALDQPLSSLRSLRVEGFQARTAKQFHAAMEKLHIVAPNLKSLNLTGHSSNPIPFRFSALRHSVQLEQLYLASFRGDYLMNHPPADPEWHFRTDLLYLRHLVRLVEVTLKEVPAWVRDDVLESIFASLPKLREFTITIPKVKGIRDFLIDPSYLTNRSLVAVTQHCPRLVRLVLDVPCLDLTVPDVLHWMRALPPRRYVPVDGVPVVPDATPYRRRGYIRLRRGCIDRFPHNPTVESQAAFFDAIDEQLQALHPK
eukprot:gene8989-6456_t